MRASPFLRLVALFAGAAAVPACVPPATPSGNLSLMSVNERQSTRTPDATRIGSAELASVDASSLRDALIRVRPEFLRGAVIASPSGGPTAPSVYIDGQYVGAPDVLRMVQVVEVAEVRYLRPVAARSLYGAGCACGAGVIDVSTRRAR